MPSKPTRRAAAPAAGGGAGAGGGGGRGPAAARPQMPNLIKDQCTVRVPLICPGSPGVFLNRYLCWKSHTANHSQSQTFNFKPVVGSNNSGTGTLSSVFTAKGGKRHQGHRTGAHAQTILNAASSRMLRVSYGAWYRVM